DRYQLHDLVRQYAREHAARTCTGAERTAAISRLVGFYTASAWRTLALLRPGDRRLATADGRWTAGGLDFEDMPAALLWMETEVANLVAAIRQTAAMATEARCSIAAELPGQLASAMFGFFDVHRCRLDDWLSVTNTVLDVARRAGNRAGEAAAL